MSAFAASAVVCLVFFNFGYAAIFIVMFIVITVIIRTNFTKEKASETTVSVIEAKDDNKKVLDSIAKAVPVYFDAQVEVVDRALENFFNDNEFKLRRDFNKASNIEYDISKVRSEYYSLANSTSATTDSKVTNDAKHFFYLTFSNMREASKAIRYMVERAVTHVANRHTIFQGEMQSSLMDINARLHMLSKDLHKMAAEPTAANVEAMVKHAKKLNRDIDRSQIDLVNIISSQHVSIHSAEMYLGFLQGIRDLANRYVAVAMQERALSQIVAGSSIDPSLNDSQMRSQVFGTTSRTQNEAMVNAPVDDEEPATDAKADAKAEANAPANAQASSNEPSQEQSDKQEVESAPAQAPEAAKEAAPAVEAAPAQDAAKTDATKE